MNIQISNLKPVVLNNYYKSTFSNDFDPNLIFEDLILKEFFKPINSNKGVEYIIDGDLKDEEYIKEFIIQSLSSHISSNEDEVKEFMERTFLNFDKSVNLPVENAYLIQEGKNLNMIMPSPKILYSPSTDIIPAAKKFIAGKINIKEFWTTFGFWKRPNTLGVLFKTEEDFNDFKKYIKDNINLLKSNLDVNTINMFKDFDKLNLNNLTESILIRTNENESNEAYSFARIITYFINEFKNIKSEDYYDIAPFWISEFIIPKTITFINIEKHAHSLPKEIIKEWSIIEKSLSSPIKIISKKQITKLTAIERNAQKIKATREKIINAQKQNNKLMKTKQKLIPTKMPTSKILLKNIKKQLDKMSNVNMSNNSYKTIKTTFQRASRRDPDNFNLKGKMISTNYKPDIHIYLDTSGSISEINYKESIKSLIYLAQKLNINLYFSSFSHVLSEETLLPTKNRSKTEIYKIFKKIPKVSGGTDYVQIWQNINKSAIRKKRMNIIITDFEWIAPNKNLTHPKNLYYIPCANMNYNYIKHSIDTFLNSCKYINPYLRNNLLF